MKNKIIEILTETIDDAEINFEDKMSWDDKLKVLPSESILSLEFITALEDEFDIEFEDEELDIDFFESIEGIEKKIYVQIKG